MTLPKFESRHFAWAGYLLNSPRTFRLSTIEGDHREGKFCLADTDRVRLEFSWATENRRSFDFAAFGRKKLASARKRGAAELKIERVEGTEGDFQLFAMIDDEARRDRMIGWSPRTHRIVEIIYSRGEAEEDRFVRGITMRQLVDQVLDEPMKWAFFDCSFVSPAGFSFQAATLNLGDMSIRLGTARSELRGPTLTVRQIYPATLALSRRPLEDWLRAWVLESWDTYRLKRPGFMGRGAIPVEQAKSSIGAGVQARTRLRSILRPVYWWMPRHCTVQVVHDPTFDRIIAVRATGVEKGIEESIRAVLSTDLHWAGFDFEG